MNEETPIPGEHIDITENIETTVDTEQAQKNKAVAIGYDREEDEAPRILASGQGAVAEQIISLAFANGVRVRKDENLVEVLSKVEVDSVIPLEAFTVVAEILNYVYQTNAIYGKPRGNV